MSHVVDGLDPTAAKAEPVNLRQVRDEAERNAISKVLSRADGNIAEAAHMLGVSRPTLYDLMKRHGLRAAMDSNVDGK